MRLFEYRLQAESLCIGERVKAGLYRPCDTRVIRYSTATGALRKYLGPDVRAAGYFLDTSAAVRYFVYAPRDRATGISKIPVTVQYVAGAVGRIFVLSNQPDLPPHLRFWMGALKSFGFGRCRIDLVGMADTLHVRGRLMTRLPEPVVGLFGVSVVEARFGYMFEPTSVVGGKYVRSILEDSLVEGPRCLVSEVRDA